MKKLFLILTMFMCIFGLTSCHPTRGENTVRVYNWGEYINPQALKLFEKETGYKVIYETYASNEDLYVKLSSGSEAYDVVVPSDYLIQRCIKEGLVQKINKDHIPNFQKVMDELKNPSYDPGSQYSIPYFWGTLGIVYNGKNIQEKLDSWDCLWDQKYKGKILMYDSQRDSIAIALKKLGFSMNSKNLQELEAAKDALVEQKPLVYAYLADESRDVMVQGDADLCAMYSGDAVLMLEQNRDLRYFIPKEGSNLFMDSFMIPKNAGNLKGAEAFINFMCRPDIARMNVDEVQGYSTPIKETYENLPKEIKNNPIAYPDLSKLPPLEVYEDYSDVNEVYYDLWAEVQAAL